MRKHTTTTQLIGGRYPLSLRLRDVWYHHRGTDRTISIAVVALVAGLVASTVADYRTRPSPPEVRPAILIIATGQPATATATARPTATPTATATATAEPTQERAPVGRSEPLPQDAPAQPEVQPEVWTAEPAICYAGCTTPTPPDPLLGPTSEVYCTFGCNQVWGPTTAPAPQGPPPTPVQADAICPPAPCPDPPDLAVAATIAAFRK